MTDIEKSEETSVDGVVQTRRKLLTSAGRVAVTAPAVALLLSAAVLPTAAAAYSIDHPGTNNTTDGDPTLNDTDGFDDANPPNLGEADGISSL